MTSKTLQTLPLELFSGVVGLLPQADRLSLSSTNSQLRELLAPSLFRAVRLEHQPESDWSGLQRFASKHAQHVRDLKFVGGGHPEPSEKDTTHSTEGEEDESPMSQREGGSELVQPSQLLPDTIAQALSGNLFPELETIRVTFDWDFDDQPPNGAWEGESELISSPQEINTIYVFEIQEDDEEVIREKEAKYPWRAFMAEVWRDVSLNHSIRTLVAENLLPKPTSAFFSKQWSEFLGRLHKLEIFMWSGDNGAGWRSNTLDGYTHFEEHLGDYFFQYTNHTTTLILAADPETPFGSDADWANCGLPLEAHHLPELQHLELRDMFISPELADFIIAHAQTSLKSLALHNCHAETSNVDNPYTWTRFLSRLDCDDVRLTRLDIVYEKQVPMLESESFESSDPESEDPERVSRLHELRQVPGTKAFSYGTCTDKYGDFWEWTDDNYDNYVKGEDLTAYHSLVARICRNVIEAGQDGEERTI
ncbi:hypothetical protein BX600DRAFT_472126 [Xylariales sp. PMI_506]|nr:hypothetical protein BX600DRAFT_472126 [Xylariales sp. PMI_506]